MKLTDPLPVRSDLIRLVPVLFVLGNDCVLASAIRHPRGDPYADMLTFIAQVPLALVTALVVGVFLCFARRNGCAVNIAFALAMLATVAFIVL